MGVLEQITKMKSQGKEDNEIIRTLQEQGIPPKLIDDAMSQAQIKDVVSKGTNMDDMEQSIMSKQPFQQQETYEEYVPEPLPEAPMPQQRQAPYVPQTYEVQQPYPYYPQQQNYSQEYSQQEEAYPQDESQQQYYGYNGGTDTGTLIEIAEQVFNDKIRKIEKQLEILNEFKIIAETRLNTTEERLKRIESMIDKLQISILEKIGSYGENINSIKKEMSMMQDSFGKVINPVLDKEEKRYLRGRR